MTTPNEIKPTAPAEGLDGGRCAVDAGSLFGCIVADPPWAYSAPGKFGKTLDHRPNRDLGESRHGAGSRARYGSMTMDELRALPVAKFAADNSHLYLWTTNAFMVEAHELAEVWGFRQSTIITWTKVRQSDGQPSMKMGYYYRGATEHCLFCMRGKLRLRGPAAPTAIFSRRLPHSQKPEDFYRTVETQSPGPYLELFARRKRLGWSSWGNEVASDVVLSSANHGLASTPKHEHS